MSRWQSVRGQEIMARLGRALCKHGQAVLERALSRLVTADLKECFQKGKAAKSVVHAINPCGGSMIGRQQHILEAEALVAPRTCMALCLELDSGRRKCGTVACQHQTRYHTKTNRTDMCIIM